MCFLKVLTGNLALDSARLANAHPLGERCLYATVILPYPCSTVTHLAVEQIATEHHYTAVGIPCCCDAQRGVCWKRSYQWSRSWHRFPNLWLRSRVRSRRPVRAADTGGSCDAAAAAGPPAHQLVSPFLNFPLSKYRTSRPAPDMLPSSRCHTFSSEFTSRSSS